VRLKRCLVFFSGFQQYLVKSGPQVELRKPRCFA
jgi:hypothetical protein